ncbi:response regulator transcription factor [soil metagenome]|nr:hypothetical protein [Actinomycetota bacterium]
MKLLVVSANPQVREQIGITVRSVERRSGRPIDIVLEARDGLEGMSMARRHAPQVVIADEIMSRAGAFALARDLKGSSPPFAGAVFILLERREDVWLARWSGADAWFVKPVDPFELASAVTGYLEGAQKEAV